MACPLGLRINRVPLYLCLIMLKFEVFKHLLEVSKKNLIYSEELTLRAPVMVITVMRIQHALVRDECANHCKASITVGLCASYFCVMLHV